MACAFGFHCSPRGGGHAMSGRKINLKGFKLKEGKLVPNERRLNVSERLRQKHSKRVKVARKLTSV